MHKGSDINRFGGTAGSFQPRSRLVQRAAIKLQQPRAVSMNKPNRRPMHLDC
jgi:hypothetical protein